MAVTRELEIVRVDLNDEYGASLWVRKKLTELSPEEAETVAEDLMRVAAEGRALRAEVEAALEAFWRADDPTGGEVSMRAALEAAAAVTPTEPEWEYEVRRGDYRYSYGSMDRALDYLADGWSVYRRIRGTEPGPWERVTPEGQKR